MTTYFKLVTGRIEKGTPSSAGYDLFYAGTEPLDIGTNPVLVPTGVRTEFSPDLVCVVKERSSLARKGLRVGAGVIDADYRDEWKVVLSYGGRVEYGTPPYPEIGRLTDRYTVRPDDKIAQFLVVPLAAVEVQCAAGAECAVQGGVRVGGFGSTDRKVV